MADNWNDMTTAQHERVRDRFMTRHEARTLAADLPSVSPATLYRYARNKDIDANGAIARSLDSDDRAWQDFLQVLQLVNVREFTHLAAASTDAELRGGWDANRQWRYTIRQSPQPPYEEVLLIEIVDSERVPARIVAESADLGLRVDQKLDEPFRGGIQMLLAESDALAKILAAQDRIVRMW